jgi:hypothetical protein
MSKKDAATQQISKKREQEICTLDEVNHITKFIDLNHEKNVNKYEKRNILTPTRAIEYVNIKFY